MVENYLKFANNPVPKLTYIIDAQPLSKLEL